MFTYRLIITEQIIIKNSYVHLNIILEDDVDQNGRTTEPARLK